MQNKSVSVLSVLFISGLLISPAVFAQEASKEASKEAAKEVSAPASEQSTNVVLDQDAQKLLDSELGDIDADTKTVVDFPARSSLGSLEMASLPGTREAIITGPSAMEPSVSKKDLPSEQLLGRITPEVFQEMADLERGNVFLKLQMQKEQLKNDLEELKSKYRQARLDEISKRENVVRSRINWWQEQEKIRLEIEQKKAETEAIEQKIEEAEALREQLRKQALERSQNQPEDVKAAITLEPEKVTQIFSDQYALIDIKGARGKLKARLKDLSDSKIITVEVNDMLPSGHVVKNITKDSIFVVYGTQQNTLMISPTTKTPVANVTSEP